MKNKQPAFTLAEVLITLGIIGVVAAMTMPVFVGKYQKKVTAAKLKKMYVNYENAIMLTESKEAVMRDQWKFDSVDERNTFIKDKIIPNLNCHSVLEKLGNSNITRQAPICILKDGSMIVFHTKSASSLVCIELFFVISANALYNNDLSYGRNTFYYSMPLSSKNNPITATRQSLLNSCKPTKENQSGDDTYDYPARDCLTLIRYDNWEIKDDYPW